MSSNRWEEKLNTIGSDEDRELLQRLSGDDPDMADALQAKLIQNDLEKIGVETVSDELHQKLYAIANETVEKRLVKKPLKLWGTWIAVAATFVIAAVLTPWQNNQPSTEEIALARQQLAMTFYYLDKTADKTRHHTQASIARGVQTAMSKAVFVVPDDDAVEL